MPWSTFAIISRRTPMQDSACAGFSGAGTHDPQRGRPAAARFMKGDALNVHYYMQFLPGARSAGTLQPMRLVRELAARGHHVTVISADYNLDTGEAEPDHDESFAGGGRLHIMRVRAPRNARGSNHRRLWSYLVFMVRAFFAGLRAPRPDAVVGSIQPLFTGLAALGVAKLRGAPFVLEVRDLWPDQLVDAGAVGRAGAMPLSIVARLLYARAARIASLTPGIRLELLKKGIPPDRVDVFPNGFDPALFEGAAAKRDAVRTHYGWGDDFVAIYTGSFTDITAVEVFAEAAKVLAAGPRTAIRIELFGEGPTKPKVLARIRQADLRNIHVRPAVPKLEVPGLLAAADVCLMSLKAMPRAHVYFENKFMDYLGAGRPVLGALDGQQAEIIRARNLGRVVAPGDGAGLARALADMSRDRGALMAMGERGRAFASAHLRLPDIIARYCDVIEVAAGGAADDIPAWSPLH